MRNEIGPSSEATTATISRPAKRRVDDGDAEIEDAFEDDLADPLVHATAPLAPFFQRPTAVETHTDETYVGNNPTSSA